MPADNLMASYIAGLQTLLPPPTEKTRAGEAVRPPSPYDAAQIDQLEAFLQQSRSMQTLLMQRWQDAATSFERSKAEVQMLAAAAADLAIAERLVRGAPDFVRMRSTTAGTEELIQRALTEPEAFLKPARLVRYRAEDGEAQTLLAATNACLKNIRKGAVDATKDVLVDVMAMDLAALKEFAEFFGKEVVDKFMDKASGLIKAAIGYVMAATDKIKALLGPEGEAEVRRRVFEFIDQIQDPTILDKGIERFLNTDGIARDAKAWVAAYQGEPSKMEAAAVSIAALNGSFAGRAKMADLVVKGLTVARLIPSLAIPPGLFAVAAGYVLVIGFILYSAHDHVDSDRFAFLDRVHGVRGVLISELSVK